MSPAAVWAATDDSIAGQVAAFPTRPAWLKKYSGLRLIEIAVVHIYGKMFL
jgi:hypothetical protein